MYDFKIIIMTLLEHLGHKITTNSISLQKFWLLATILNIKESTLALYF